MFVKATSATGPYRRLFPIGQYEVCTVYKWT